MTPISKELETAINQEAATYSALKRSSSIAESFCTELGYKDGAAAYAHYKERCEELECWKREADSLLSPLLDYGLSKEANIPLGESMPTVILQRAKQFEQAKKALEELLSWHTESLEFDLVGKVERAKALLASWKEEGKEGNNG